MALPNTKNDNNHDHNHDDDDNIDDDTKETEQIRIVFRLSPDCTDTSLKVPYEPISVPADIGRKGLQAIINHLLDRKITNDDDDADDNEEDDSDIVEKQLPALSFDFIVGDTNTSTNTSSSTRRRLLRTGLEREARKLGLSFEEAIIVLYFPSNDVLVPKQNSDPLPDWIGCMSYYNTATNDSENSNNSAPPLLITGCYDGSIHVHELHIQQRSDLVDTPILNKVAIISSPNQSGPIKCIDSIVVKNASDDNNPSSSLAWIASGCMNHTLSIYLYNSVNKKLSLYGTCIDGHRSAIGCVDLINNKTVLSSSSQEKLDGPKSTLLASADWDGGLCIWNLLSNTENDDDDEEEDKPTKSNSNKKSKTITGSITIKKQEERMFRPIVTIQAHSSQVSGVSWGNYENQTTTTQQVVPHHVTTGSWDHSIKVWDIEQCDCIVSLNGSRVVTCLDTSYHASNVVATGHPDCTIRLWDTRVGGNSNNADNSSSTTSVLHHAVAVSDNIFRPSHKGWVSDVQWSRKNPYQLASTSHDGTIKLWDIRSSIPLRTVKAFPTTATPGTTTIKPKQQQKQHKGLAVAFGDGSATASNSSGGGGMIFAGGTDNVVHLYQFQ